MEKIELLQYLDFSCRHGFVLEVTGISGKKSSIIVENYNDQKLFGRFSSSGSSMSYRFENVASCHFSKENDQRNFEKALRLEQYGEKGQDLEKIFTTYKEYYQTIVQNRKATIPDEPSEYNPDSLKDTAIKRFEAIFHHTFMDSGSLLFHYFSGESVNTADSEQETNDEPVLLLSRSNYSQKQAIEKALTDRISVIEGPPGTGKTTTILSIIANLVTRGKRIAVVSKNVSAIDNIQEELDLLPLPPFYIRLGNRKVISLLNQNLKDHVQNTMHHADLLTEEKSDEPDLHSLYAKLKAMEANINCLVEEKNQLQEDENMLRHIEKRKAALQEEYKFRGNAVFQPRSLNSMRREIDRIAYSLQQLDYKGRYSIWNQLKNRFIWHLDREEFESEGLLLQYQLEYFYLEQEIENFKKDLAHARLEERQKELAHIYDGQYIHASQQYLKNFLRRFFQKPECQAAAKRILSDSSSDIFYKSHKSDAHTIYPVTLTTADALVYNFPDLIDSENKFDYIIVDEASQCDLITGIPVLYLAERCVIVGDQKQLSAITDERFSGLPAVAEPYDYFEESLLSSVQKALHLKPTLLREHYRCDYSIINYCNKFYYGGELIIYTEASSDAMQLLAVEQGRYAQVTNNHSFCNDREVRAIESITGPTLHKAYVITPFSGQGELLRKHFDCDKDTCGTIHTFQGKGQDTVFLSAVLNDLPFANAHLKSAHCLFQKDLVNVAVSRAKKHFILVCDAFYLRRKNMEMRNLIDYIRSYGQDIPEKTVCLFDGLYQEIRAYTRHDNLDNVFEEKLYQSIDSYCRKHLGMYCRIKLPLADLVRDQTYLEEHPDIRNFVLHRNTHVDFTLCNAVDNPILAIELDGRDHRKPDQQARDAKKDAALQHMQIPLWRLSSKEALTEEDFEKEVDILLGYREA